MTLRALILLRHRNLKYILITLIYIDSNINAYIVFYIMKIAKFNVILKYDTIEIALCLINKRISRGYKIKSF